MNLRGNSKRATLEAQREERLPYCRVPVTLDGKPAEISGYALSRATIVTTERDDEGQRSILYCP
jgi:hypothetical protein